MKLLTFSITAEIHAAEKARDDRLTTEKAAAAAREAGDEAAAAKEEQRKRLNSGEVPVAAEALARLPEKRSNEFKRKAAEDAVAADEMRRARQGTPIEAPGRLADLQKLYLRMVATLKEAKAKGIKLGTNVTESTANSLAWLMHLQMLTKKIERLHEVKDQSLRLQMMGEVIQGLVDEHQYVETGSTEGIRTTRKEIKAASVATPTGSASIENVADDRHAGAQPDAEGGGDRIEQVKEKAPKGEEAVEVDEGIAPEVDAHEAAPSAEDQMLAEHGDESESGVGGINKELIGKLDEKLTLLPRKWVHDPSAYTKGKTTTPKVETVRKRVLTKPGAKPKEAAKPATPAGNEERIARPSKDDSAEPRSRDTEVSKEGFQPE